MIRHVVMFRWKAGTPSDHVDFASRDDYVIYRDHPVHRVVREEMFAPNIEDRASIQFELD